VDVALEVAEIAAAGSMTTGDFARVMDGLIHAVDAHLQFEATEIAPRLDEMSHLGPDRLVRLFQRHDRLRDLLEQLRAFPMDDPALVAGATESLLRDIQADIDESVRDHVIPEVTNDDPVVTDELTS
jgi:hypothetical protein